MVAIKENKKEILEILLKNDRVNFEVKDLNGDGLLTIAHKAGKTGADRCAVVTCRR